MRRVVTPLALALLAAIALTQAGCLAPRVVSMEIDLATDATFEGVLSAELQAVVFGRERDWRVDPTGLEAGFLQHLRTRSWGSLHPAKRERLRASGIHPGGLTRQNVLPWLARLPFLIDPHPGLGAASPTRLLEHFQRCGAEPRIDAVEARLVGGDRVLYRVPFRGRSIIAMTRLAFGTLAYVGTDWDVDPREHIDPIHERDEWVVAVLPDRAHAPSERHAGDRPDPIEIRWYIHWGDRFVYFKQGDAPPRDAILRLRVTAPAGVTVSYPSTAGRLVPRRAAESTLGQLTRGSFLRCRLDFDRSEASRSFRERLIIQNGRPGARRLYRKVVHE